jgi:hypothetical protein
MRHPPGDARPRPGHKRLIADQTTPRRRRARAASGVIALRGASDPRPSSCCSWPRRRRRAWTATCTFTDVRSHDSLFRHVVSEILRREPSRENKAELLGLLRDAGVFLIDLKLDRTDGSPLASHVPSLIRRVRRLQPHKIILIKATVYDAAYRPLRDAGFPVVDVRVPFPGSGQQARFREAFRTARRKRPRET